MTQSQKEAIERGVALLPELKNATFEGDPWITLRSGHVETIIAALEAAKVLAEEAVSSKLAHDCGFNAGLIMGRAAAPGAGGEMVEMPSSPVDRIGGPNGHFKCRRASVIQCRLWECQEHGVCTAK